MTEGRRGLVVLAAVVVALLLLGLVALATRDGGDDDAASSTAAATTTVVGGFPRDATVYRGLGAWIDVFDYVPAYQADGRPPLLTPRDVELLALQGVRTLYLQAARLDERTPAGLVDAELLHGFLVAAHRHDMRVVAWYLPAFTDLQADLDRLLGLHRFEHRGQRFDGLAVDIEATSGVEDHVERSRRLVELSQRLRAEVGADALGAIVLPPVLLEVVNQDFWPAFPWRDIAGLYDVWLPMTYWTDRREDSGYRNGFTYVEESVRRMRANLGLPDAPVHPVGGIGDRVSEGSLYEYLDALVATGAVGGSIYDVRTMSGGAWAILRGGVPAVTG